jgi:hypothetical protein
MHDLVFEFCLTWPCIQENRSKIMTSVKFFQSFYLIRHLPDPQFVLHHWILLFHYPCYASSAKFMDISRKSHFDKHPFLLDDTCLAIILRTFSPVSSYQISWSPSPSHPPWRRLWGSRRLDFVIRAGSFNLFFIDKNNKFCDCRQQQQPDRIKPSTSTIGECIAILFVFRRKLCCL